ncbi:MAG: hypothetical protein LBG43_03775 [Treponema sp.]|jgi:hypothetical protein|nr:hypothetical protein [Treponema sp.]
MAKKIKEILEYSKYDLEQLHLEKCEYCRGKDGKNKDIYKTLEYAMDTIEYLEKERNIYLNPYPCPLEMVIISRKIMPIQKSKKEKSKYYKIMTYH